MDDLRLLRAAILNGVEPPMLVVMRLEAKGFDVSELIARVRQSLPMKAAA